MTVFDRLEAQLIAAHPNRGRRSVPRLSARVVFTFAAAAAAAAVIVVAGLSGGSATTSPPTHPGSSVPPVDRSATTVAVLNGTTVPGLGRDAAYALARRGWKIGTVTNAPDQAQTSSCVYFASGHARAASLIGQELGIRHVIPATPDIRVVAGRDAVAIVVVGSDHAR